MSKNNFAVYTKIGCPYCTKVIGALQLSEQRYVEYKLGRDFEKDGFYTEFGEGSTFPQITVDGKNLGGCVETVKYLRENNLV
jgi:glutaredoxin